MCVFVRRLIFGIYQFSRGFYSFSFVSFCCFFILICIFIVCCVFFSYHFFLSSMNFCACTHNFFSHSIYLAMNSVFIATFIFRLRKIKKLSEQNTEKMDFIAIELNWRGGEKICSGKEKHIGMFFPLNSAY